jgi:thiamine monophosphate kinase
MEVNGDDDTGVSLELGHSTVQITKDMYVHDRRSQERMRKRHAAREAAAREAAAEKGRHLSVAS